MKGWKKTERCSILFVMKDFLVEYWQFIRANKSYWLIPLMVGLAAVGALIIFAKGSAVAPFVYTFF